MVSLNRAWDNASELCAPDCLAASAIDGAEPPEERFGGGGAIFNILPSFLLPGGYSEAYIGHNLTTSCELKLITRVTNLPNEFLYTWTPDILILVLPNRYFFTNEGICFAIFRRYSNIRAMLRQRFVWACLKRYKG